MGPASIDLSSLPDLCGLHPALQSTAYKCRVLFVRCLAYASGVALVAMLLADLFAAAPTVASIPAAIRPDWIPASRPHPAFTVNHVDLSNIPEPYQILRNAEGGRKDSLRWIASAGSTSGARNPDTEIEIYRPGGELPDFASPEAGLAARMKLPDGWTSEASGVVASKFGQLKLLRFAAPGGPICVAFSKNFAVPHLQISGWSCQPQPISAQRAFLACTLDHLVLLSAGNDPAMAELFARAELRRTGCNAPQSPGKGDWIATAQEPALRGAF